MQKNKAVFLDRDGVINEDSGNVGKIKDFVFLPRVFEALKILQSSDYLLIILTNQAGIAKKYYASEDFLELNNWMLNEFDKRGIKIEKVYYCPHHPDENCNCRKPKPGMFNNAISDFNIDEEKTWIIGDKLSDIETGKHSPCKKILLKSKYLQGIDINPEIPLLNNLYEAAEYILKNSD